MSEKPALTRNSSGGGSQSARGSTSHSHRPKSMSSSRSPRGMSSMMSVGGSRLSPMLSPRPAGGPSPRISPMPSPKTGKALLFGLDLAVVMHSQQGAHSKLTVPIFMLSVGNYFLENCARMIMEPLDAQSKASRLMLENDIQAGSAYQFPRGTRSAVVVSLLAAFLRRLPAALIGAEVRASLCTCAQRVSAMVAQGAQSSKVAPELVKAMQYLPELNARVLMEAALIGNLIGLNGVHNGATFDTIADLIFPPSNFRNNYLVATAESVGEDTFMRLLVTYAPFVASLRGDRFLDQKSSDQVLTIQNRVWLPSPHSDIVSLVHITPFDTWALRANGSIVRTPGGALPQDAASKQPLLHASVIGARVWVRGEMHCDIREASTGHLVTQLAQGARCFMPVGDAEVWGGAESQIIRYDAVSGVVVGVIPLVGPAEPVRFLCRLSDNLVVAAGKTALWAVDPRSFCQTWDAANGCLITGLAAAGHSDTTAYITDIGGVISSIDATGKLSAHQLDQFPINHLVVTGSIAITSHQQWLLVVNLDSTNALKVISKITTYHASGISGLSLLGSSLCVAGADGSVSSWLVGSTTGARETWRRTVGPSVFASAMFTGSTGVSINPAEIEFDVKSVLGRGTFGLVYEGRWRGQAVAVKDIDLQKFSTAEREMFVEQMANVVTHAHALTLYCYSITGNRLRIVEDIAPTSLKKLLRDKKRKMRFEQKMILAEHVAHCLSWMHAAQPPICFLDLRSSNVLLDAGKTVLLDDICGVARLKIAAPVKDPSILYSFFRYAAPEMLEDQPEASPAADVYSFGLLLWELLACRSPFHSCNTLAELRILVCESQGRPAIPAGTPKVLEETIHQCWYRNPNKRPTIDSLFGVFEEATVQHVLKDPKSHELWTNAFQHQRRVPAAKFFAVLWDYMQMNSAARPYYTELFSVILVNKKMVTMSSFADFFLHFADLERDVSCAESVEDTLCMKGFHGGIGREEAERMLKKPGDYLLRITSLRDSFMLMIKPDSGSSNNGFTVTSSSNSFSSISELVANYRHKMQLKEPVGKSPFQRIKAKFSAKKSIIKKGPVAGEDLPSYYVETDYADMF